MTNKLRQNMSVVTRVAHKSFDDLRLSQILKFRVPERQWSRQSYTMRGISALPGGQIIIADSDGRKLFIFKYNGMLEKSISCQIAGTGPNDVTYIKDSEDLVAISTSSGIQIINIQSTIVIENIITDGECQGIAYNNGALICSVKAKGIQHIQITNKTITTLVKAHDTNERPGISVHGNKIYETSFKTSIVNCYTMEGKHLWQFKNTSVLQYPTGITTDYNSNIYVATFSSDRVIVLSSDGKKFKTILTQIDGLQFPTAIHFDQNRLIVANLCMPIFIYSVS